MQWMTKCKEHCLVRGLDKREYFDDTVSYFSSKPYVVTSHLNSLDETVQMRGHNMFFMQNQQKLSLIITKYSLLSRALVLSRMLCHYMNRFKKYDEMQRKTRHIV